MRNGVLPSTLRNCVEELFQGSGLRVCTLTTRTSLARFMVLSRRETGNRVVSGLGQCFYRCKCHTHIHTHIIYVYIYIYNMCIFYIYIYIHLHARARTHTHTHTRARAHNCVCVCVQSWVGACSCVCTLMPANIFRHMLFKGPRGSASRAMWWGQIALVTSTFNVL